ncbi:unnamed protein product [Polarella glacialis]|uniref:Uncharacterized protein n=1 Tax=Polarella glacialis TaxID=89957 RepID=A0A813JXX3_POLGL|nr:unnamed protein product [Polarella glacialis]
MSSATQKSRLSDGIIEFAKTHEELKGAFLTFQKDADQIYPGWKEKLGYTGESSVQAATFDWAKKAAAALYIGGWVYAKTPNVEGVYWNEVGYCPDGTAMNLAGNETNHPEKIKNMHTPGSTLPKSFYMNAVGYLPDGTPLNMAGNEVTRSTILRRLGQIRTRTDLLCRPHSRAMSMTLATRPMELLWTRPATSP